VNEATLSACSALTAAVEPVALPIIRSEAIALPPNWKLQDTEHLLPFPKRARARVQLCSPTDFLAYIERYKRPNSLAMVNPSFAALSAGGTLATVIIDYHDPETDDAGTAGWCDHVAEFTPAMSPAYALLCDIDGIILPQEEFAGRLRDLARFCTSHAAADLLEIVRTLTLTSRGEYASLNDDISGSVRLGYDVQVDAKAGTAARSLEIPREIHFGVPIFLGDDESRDIVAELLYRVPKQAGGQVQLGIRMPERRWLEDELTRSLAATIREKSGLLTVVGTR
jgi:uncharacterized protein YfdQ (DUF2303 family)